MAPILKKGGTKLNLVFALGYVLVFKSTRFDLAGNIGDIQLDLEHQKDILTFRKGERSRIYIPSRWLGERIKRGFGVRVYRSMEVFGGHDYDAQM
jgi:hypothetical protein